MSEYIIKGGKRLEGEVEISGSKNAALPDMISVVILTYISTANMLHLLI